jgi:hypothetical protein
VVDQEQFKKVEIELKYLQMTMRDQKDDVRTLQEKLFGMESMSTSLTEKTNKFEVIN